MNGYGNNSGYRGVPLAARGHLVGNAAGTPTPPSVANKLNPGAGQQVLVPGEPGAVTRRHFDVSRIIEAGGNLTSQMLHPSIIPFEQLYRRLPEEGMYNPLVNPQNPFTFELGAFQVPPRMSLLIFDLRPDVYRFSGVDPGDFVPLEERRFGSLMGFDLTIDQNRKGEVSFELDPVAIQRTSQQAFPNQNLHQPSANASQQAVAAANSFASSSGAGTALLPQRPTRFGALNIPFTLYARSGQTVQVRCVIFRPIPAPIAFVEYDLAGVLVPEMWATNMAEAIKPPQNEADEGIR